MGKYFQDKELFRVTFEDGQWVDVKQELSQEDDDYIKNQMFKAGVKSETPDTKDTKELKPVVGIDFGKQALLERSIVAWSFVDDAGKPVPVAPQNISALRVKYRFRVIAEIDRLNKEATAFQKN
jgi:hypothetical protein